MAFKNILEKGYAKTLFWCGGVFVFLTIGLIISSSYFYWTQKHHQKQFLECGKLNAQLENWAKKIDNQLASGYLNVREVFIDFGTFQNEMLNHIEIETLAKMDSLVGQRENLKLTHPHAQLWRQSKLAYHTQQIDQLILSSDGGSFFEPLNHHPTLNQEGFKFKKELSNHHLTMIRLLKQSATFYKTLAQNHAHYVFLGFLIYSVLVAGLILFLMWMVNFRILKDIHHLLLNTTRISSGKTTLQNLSGLQGESKAIGAHLMAIHSDFMEAIDLLENISTQNTSNIELTGNKKNIFYPSISKMLSQLKSLRENEKIRNWDIKGTNMLTKIVNQYGSNPDELYPKFLTDLIKYLGALQGGIFISTDHKRLRMTASYAYDRNKKIQKNIRMGEGLVGEVFEERQEMYIENVPNEHFNIQSALGSATPSAVMILPLLERANCYGVLEISSFGKLDDTQKAFIQKAGQILAAAVNNLKINERTRFLLEESNTLAQQLASQDEVKGKLLKEFENTLDQMEEKLFLKEKELKNERFEHQQQHAHQKNHTDRLLEEIESLKEALVAAQTDNEAIRQLALEIKELEALKEDQQETIKIKNLKIERLKSKIDQLNTPKS